MTNSTNFRIGPNFHARTREINVEEEEEEEEQREQKVLDNRLQALADPPIDKDGVTKLTRSSRLTRIPDVENLNSTVMGLTAFCLQRFLDKSYPQRALSSTSHADCQSQLNQC